MYQHEHVFKTGREGLLSVRPYGTRDFKLSYDRPGLFAEEILCLFHWRPGSYLLRSHEFDKSAFLQSWVGYSYYIWTAWITFRENSIRDFSLCAYYEIPNYEFHSGYLQLWMDYSHQVWKTCIVALKPLDSSPQTINSGTEL